MKPIARQKDLIIQESGEEILIYDLKTNKAISLNNTSALIWNNCNGKNSIADIAQVIKKTFKEKVTEEYVLFAIQQLNSENLLDKKTEIITAFKGMSRRKIIKKVGFTAMISLPIVASLTAPMAIDAQSGCPPVGNAMQISPSGCPCAMGNDCINGSGSCVGRTPTNPIGTCT